MRAQLSSAVALLAACTGYSGPSAETRAERAPRPVTDAPVDVAGGETSEFSGDIGACPEIASSEPLDLQDPEVAPWVAMAQGHHEQTLGWRRLMLSDEAAGFTEHTSVSIDVNVLGGRDIVYGNGGNLDDEVRGCGGLRGRQIELEIRLATADGAVDTTFRNWFQPGPTESGGILLHHHGLNPDGTGSVALNGTLELNGAPARSGTPFLWFDIQFSANGVQGTLSPVVPPEVPAWNRSNWTPIEATFPDDPCGPDGRSLGLDERAPGIGGTPRSLYQRMTRTRGRQTLPAVWKSSPPGVEPNPSLEVPLPTDVTLVAGEPTRACVIGTSVTVYAPVTITTADGRVNLTQPFAYNLFESSAYIGERTPWVPAADFNGSVGISGVALESGYGAVYFQHNVNWQNNWVEGALEVQQWDDFRDGDQKYPVLTWCRSPQCAP